MRDTTQPGEEPVTVRSRGFLPHWERKGAIYFVTYRLADSLPQHIRAQYEAEYQALLAKARAGEPKLFAGEKERADRLRSTRIQRYLDAGVGACHLAKPAIAEIVAESLRHFNGARYHLLAWCIMPNHVHVIVQPIGSYTLTTILQTWKSFTSHKVQQLFGIPEPFWQHEYYDHLIRDEQALWRLVAYVVQNPIKANLPDWHWVDVSLPPEDEW